MIRFLKYTWAFPNTFVGFLFLLIVWMCRGNVQKVNGAIELHGIFIERFLKLFNAGAMTLGHVILGQNEMMLKQCRAHEHVHIKQYEQWGIFFLPAYAISSLYAVIRGKHHYYDNHFELEAYSKSK